VNEETLVRTLEVNDELCTVLKDLENPIGLFQRNSGGGKVAAAGVGLEAEFDAFGIVNDGTTNQSSTLTTTTTPSTTTGGSGGLEDLLAPSPTQDTTKHSNTSSSTLDDLLTLSTDGMTASGAGAAVGTQKKDDEFDNFFK